LDRRVEVLVPVQAKKLVDYLRHRVLDVCLADDTKAWDLQSNAEYVRRQRNDGKHMDSQTWFMQHPGTKSQLRQ
jgi:polyphosphate kinase